MANIALHGMEERIKQFAEVNNYKGRKRDSRKAISLIRYADDFVLLHEEETVILICAEIISKWLKDMGLELKPSKTRITHTLNEYKPPSGLEKLGYIHGLKDEEPGFDFLGFNIRQYRVSKYDSKQGFKTFIKPSQTSQKKHYNAIARVIETHKAAPQPALISRLNPIIRGWSNYFSTVVSKEIYSKLDHLTYQKLEVWANRRHPHKSKSWVANKYWHSEGERNWVFSSKENGNTISLKTHAETSIVRHIKVKGEASPYDGNLVYWSIRMGKNPRMPTRASKLLKQQKGKCAHCGLTFRENDEMEVDHIIPKSQGGKDEYKNLQLLHRHCHDTKTARDRKSTKKTEKEHLDGLMADGTFKW